MKHLMHRLARTSRGLMGLHVEDEDLLAFRDEELSGLARWCVENHLGHCNACQRKSELLEHDLRTFKMMDEQVCPSALPDLPRGLSKLRQAIEDWEARNLLPDDFRAPAPPLTEASLRQLSRDFSLYLGDHATAALLLKLRAGQVNRRNVLVEAESVLGDFIGARAASAVTQRILHAQVAKGRSMPGPLAS